MPVATAEQPNTNPVARELFGAMASVYAPGTMIHGALVGEVSNRMSVTFSGMGSDAARRALIARGFHLSRHITGGWTRNRMHYGTASVVNILLSTLK